VTWFPSYGAEIRGGTANCTVIIADREIGSPLVQNPSAMLILNDASFKKFEPRIKPSGDLFLNTSLVQLPPTRNDLHRIEIRANDIAEELGISASPTWSCSAPFSEDRRRGAGVGPERIEIGPSLEASRPPAVERKGAYLRRRGLHLITVPSFALSCTSDR